MKERSTPCRKAEADAHVSKTDVAMGTYQEFGGLMNMIETPKHDGSKEDTIRTHIERSYIDLLDHLSELVDYLYENED